MKKTEFALLAALALGSTQAMAIPFSEVGDAGSLSAQYAGTDITSITGSTGAGDSEDLFRFTWGGGQFEAATNGLFGSSRDFDTMLFLFDNAGTFITSNDDTSGPSDGAVGNSFGSYISANLGAGDYLLGISGWSNDALNGSGQEFRTQNATGTLTSWQGGGGTGSYTIGINSVPEPAPLALLALGLTAFGLARRKAR